MVLQVLSSNDEYYESCKDRNKVADVNDLAIGDPLIDDLTTTRIGDEVVHMPSCVCGNLRSAYNKGMMCHCGTVVRDRYMDFDPVLWARVPEGIPVFINPAFLVRFREALPKIHKELFTWICDKNFNPKTAKGIVYEDSPSINAIMSIEGFVRNYVFFINHMEDILLAYLSRSTASTNKKIVRLIHILRTEHEDAIFSARVPFMGKRFVVMETASVAVYAFKDAFQTKALVRNYQTGIFLNKDPGKLVCNLLDGLSKLVIETQKTIIGGKGGVAKGYLLGLRGAFTLRCVTSTLQWSHHIDEIHLPWGAAIVTFRPHLINILSKKGFTWTQIDRMLIGSIHVFNQHISNAFDEMLASKGYISAVIMRNPAQSNYGTISLKCTRIKRNPDDTTISLSALIMVVMNMDVDGDEGNVTIPLDQYMEDAFSVFLPKWLIGGNQAGVIFKKIEPGNEAVAVIANAIRMERKEMGV